VNRRGFLGSILAGAIAPAIVRASSLMKLAPGLEELESGIVVPTATLRADNQLLTVEMITREASRVISKQMGNVYRVTDAGFLGGNEFRVGDFITIGK
jgi:hypothetical protein